ncbi:MAG TPA: 3-isopropylmalate dehydrogenase [Rhodocyclaceae bacterium]|nr:3-isopropylmalate dehydrogenase [Rhodocyclaceae bacterium]
MKICVMPGDGIGKEITPQAVRVLQALGIKAEYEEAPVGGEGYRAAGHPLPEASLKLAKESDAILFGAIGDFSLDTLPRELRPEQAILGLRRELNLFANFRPALVYPELVHASTMKEEVISGLDILIVRELTGDIYFGQPRAIHTLPNGEREGYDTMRYKESEIIRVAHVAFQAAQKRSKRLCSVDKANVLETMQLWREVVTGIAKEYPDVKVEHMYVDNASMQLLKNPKQFDVILTGNMFGDILSDAASMLTGSIGMLPSASLNEKNFGLYEPIHGSAPDIAGKNLANPLATILSAAMMLRYSFAMGAEADHIEAAVKKVLAQGYRTGDINEPGAKLVGTKEMGDAVLAAL